MKLIKEMKQRNCFEELKYLNQRQSTLPINCKYSEDYDILR